MVDLYYGTAINTLIGPIDNYESLIWTERFNDYCDFELVLPFDASIFSDFNPGRFLVHSSKSTRVMIGDSLEIENGKMKITGRDFSWVLNRRIYDRTQEIEWYPEDLLRQAFNRTISASGVTSYRSVSRYNYIGYPSDQAGLFSALPKIRYDLNHQTVYEIYEEVSKPNNFGFRVDRNDTSGNMELSLYFGVDRSNTITSTPDQTVILSPKLNNLEDGRFIISDVGMANDGFMLATLEGEGTYSEEIINTTSRPRDLSRYETVIDLKDTFNYRESQTPPPPAWNPVRAPMREISLAKLNLTNKLRPTYDGVITDLGPYKYGTHFNMGDIVLLVTEFGHETRSRVVEYTTSVNDEGVTSYPTLESVQT